jgi:hypothetical protein
MLSPGLSYKTFYIHNHFNAYKAITVRSKNLLQCSLGANVIKLFTAVINSLLYKARAFVVVSDFHPSLTFAGKAGANQSGDPKRAPL